MKQTGNAKLKLWVLCLVVLLLAALSQFLVPSTFAETPIPVKDHIQFIDLSEERIDNSSKESSQPFFYLELPYRIAGQNAGVVVFEETTLSKTIRVKRLGTQTKLGELVKVFEFARFSEIGTVEVREEGSDFVFIVMEDGGTGYHQIWLHLLNPQSLEIVEVELGFSHYATEPITDYFPSQNFYLPENRAERLFLEQVKFDYGYVSEEEVKAQPKNPAYAYYYWKKDNGEIQDAPMHIRRYKGKPNYISELVVGEKDGSIEYLVQFKAGVIAYDQQEDEHYVLFHPDDMYNWPSRLKKVGPYLVVGTHGEGLAIVNLDTFHLKRIDLGVDYRDVHRITLLESNKVRINDTLVIDLTDS